MSEEFKIRHALRHKNNNSYGSSNGCMGKIRWIFEHTGILLSYQEVTALCKMWAQESGHPDNWGYEDTWAKLHNLDAAGSLKEELARFRRKKKLSVLTNYLTQETKIYAS